MKSILVLFISTILFTSCGGYKSGVLQKESEGYLKFVGNITNVTVEVGDSITFSLNPETELYKLNPGKYTVKVFRDNVLKVERILIIQSGNTIEVEIP